MAQEQNEQDDSYKTQKAWPGLERALHKLCDAYECDFNASWDSLWSELQMDIQDAVEERGSQIVYPPDAGETLQAMLHFYLACLRGEKLSIKTSAGEIMSPALAEERIVAAMVDELANMERTDLRDKMGIYAYEISKHWYNNRLAQLQRNQSEEAK